MPLTKFIIVGVKPEGSLRFQGKSYNLESLTDEEAEFLFNNKVEFIQKAPTKATKVKEVTDKTEPQQ
jgi:hypothetical protein